MFHFAFRLAVFPQLSDNFRCHFIDYRSPECVHAATVAGRISRRVSGNGTHGCESVSGDPDGFGSRAHVLPPLPDAVRYQALTLRRHYSQGGFVRHFYSLIPMKIA